MFYARLFGTVNKIATSIKAPKRRMRYAPGPVAGSSSPFVTTPPVWVAITPVATATAVVPVTTPISGFSDDQVTPVATAIFGLEGAFSVRSPDGTAPVVNSRIASTPALMVSFERDIAVFTVNI